MLTGAAGVVALEGAVRHGSCPFLVIQPRTFGCRNLNLGAATWNLASCRLDYSLEAPRHNQQRDKWHSMQAVFRNQVCTWQLLRPKTLLLLQQWATALGAEGWRNRLSNRYQSYPSERLAVLERGWLYSFLLWSTGCGQRLWALRTIRVRLVSAETCRSG